MGRIRQVVEETEATNNTVQGEEAIAKMLSFFGRQGDFRILKDAIKDAYSIGIGKVTVGENQVDTFRRGNFSDMVEGGEIDALNVGWGIRVVRAKATLFTEPGLNFSLVHKDDASTPKKDRKKDNTKDVSPANEVLKRHRDAGQFDSVNIAVDKTAVSVGSCLNLVTYSRGSLRYKRITPNKVRFVFMESIIEDGAQRPVDMADIEDASAVIIRVGQVDTNKYSYIGIIGSNYQYPLGRYVTFTSDIVCKTIPAPGTDGAVDYQLLDGEDGKPGTICNPLSYYAATNPEMDIPEYPLAILKGGVTDSDALLPIYDTLYQQSLIFDKKSSHILDKADEKAAGTLAIKETHEAAGKPLPRCLTGKVHLQVGQEIEDIAHDASACTDADAILRTKMIDAASSYAVPDFMVVSEDYTVDAASGIALEVKAKPLEKDRSDRVKENRPYVKRLFAIERAYLGFKNQEDESVIKLLNECIQEWEPGKLVLPENKKEKTERINARMEAGTLDVIGAIRIEENFSSDEEAIQYYETMKERAEKYPKLNQDSEPEQVGLLRGMGG